MLPKRRRAVTFHYDQLVDQRPTKRAREQDEADITESTDQNEELLIDFVSTNKCVEAAALMSSKNICGVRLDQISIISEHYKCDSEPSLVDPSIQFEYTLLDMTIIYGYIELAKLLSDYGARAISPFISADDNFAEFIAELKAHQRSRATACGLRIS